MTCEMCGKDAELREFYFPYQPVFYCCETCYQSALKWLPYDPSQLPLFEEVEACGKQ